MEGTIETSLDANTMPDKLAFEQTTTTKTNPQIIIIIRRAVNSNFNASVTN
jgi:hypothetical protein